MVIEDPHHARQGMCTVNVSEGEKKETDRVE